jgi:hypothetical protein
MACCGWCRHSRNGTWPITQGSVTPYAKRKTAEFSVTIPLSYAGACEALADLGDNSATITVLTCGNDPRGKARPQGT